MPVISTELYERFANINKIDIAIAEAEKEYADGTAVCSRELFASQDHSRQLQRSLFPSFSLWDRKENHWCFPC